MGSGVVVEVVAVLARGSSVRGLNCVNCIVSGRVGEFGVAAKSTCVEPTLVTR